MKKIYFDREYILNYNIVVVDTGEIVLQGKKKIVKFENSDLHDIIKLLVRNLHKTDGIKFELTFRPVIVEPLLPFVF